jgi:hypothetical protein
MSNPNTSNKSSNRSDDIDKEVSNLLKKNADKQRSTYKNLEELKLKYKDEEIVDSIMRKYNEKMKRIRKLSEKIKERLVSKYPNLSMKEYIDKIADYKKKYNFDDSEMQAIVNLVLINKSNVLNPEALDENYNEMSKALGFIPASYNLSGKLHVKKDELDQFQMILTIASATKELHNQVTLQSLIYNDCDTVALQYKFDKNKIANIFSFVHPVVAALFLPKFDLLDQHMLMASIANLVAYKANGQELQTQPEYELYWDIATDPAETACISKQKPFTDLVNRCNVQTKLWEAVLNLRQGKYYTNDLNSFIMAIDNCRASVFDAADLAYVKDEGTVMRKLLAAFSIRPTIVLTMPVYGITPLTSHISAVTTSHVTTLPMITMRIPITIGGVGGPIKLETALNQKQLYIHHRQLTVKEQKILYSRELLIFYVHRRHQTINTARLTNPYSITFLPSTMNHFEKLLDADVILPEHLSGIQLPNAKQTFRLKSVVIVEVNEIKREIGCKDEDTIKIITGCSALIRVPEKIAESYIAKDKSGQDTYCPYIYYNPLQLKSSEREKESGEKYSSLSIINTLLPITATHFDRLAKTQGTLFVFHTADNIKGPIF